MRTSYPKPLETMERISRQYLCDHFDEILERVDKEDIGFVILNEEGKDGEVLIPYRWTEFFVDEDFGIVVNSAQNVGSIFLPSMISIAFWCTS